METLWKRLLHKIAKKIGLYGTLDSEKALREKNRKILELEQQVEQLTQQVGFAQQAIAETTVKRHAIVYIDRTVQGAYEQPSPRTDPALQLRLEAQKRRLQEQEEEEKFKQLLDVDTKELKAILAHPGGITRSGVASKYVTGKLKPITLQKQTQTLEADDAFLL